MLGSSQVHRHPYCKVLWENCNFQIWGQRTLGSKIWPRGPNYLKYHCWGPAKSLDTHIVRFCEKIAIFKFGAKGPLDPKFGPGVQIVSNMIAGSIDTHIMGPVENIPGTEAKMAKKANVTFFDLRQMLTCRFAAGKKSRPHAAKCSDQIWSIFWTYTPFLITWNPWVDHSIRWELAKAEWNFKPNFTKTAI